MCTSVRIFELQYSALSLLNLSLKSKDLQIFSYKITEVTFTHSAILYKAKCYRPAAMCYFYEQLIKIHALVCLIRAILSNIMQQFCKGFSLFLQHCLVQRHTKGWRVQS